MPPPFFTAPDGARLAYSDQGQGLPLLCLPGLTRTMADFDYLAPNLPPLRLIRMDYRGRGASPWTGAATYTVPTEALDVIALLDHLQLPAAAVIGTSRGGLVAMCLARIAKSRLLGVCFNDIGPVIERAGLDRIITTLGRPPAAPTLDAFAQSLPAASPGFKGVPPTRWQTEAARHFRQTETGLALTYDPALRDAFLNAFHGPATDSWPMFDACAGIPLALIRGENSDLLSLETATEMRRRRPDMIFASVPDRAHIPFLDEPDSLTAIRAFLARVAP